MPLEGLGRPISLVATPAGGSATTIDDLFDWGGTPDCELTPHVSGNKRFPKHLVVGNDQSKIMIKTTDIASAIKFTKGLKVTSIVLTVQGPSVTTTAGSVATGLQHTKLLTCTLSSGYVSEVVEYAGDNSGNEASVTLTIMPMCAADGTEPTFTWAFATAEE